MCCTARARARRDGRRGTGRAKGCGLMAKRVCKVSDKLAAPELARLNADIAKLAERELTLEGFLKAPAKIFRTGVQQYTKLELGIDASLDIVRLYRSPEEV